jgi:hypothetical protein
MCPDFFYLLNSAGTLHLHLRSVDGDRYLNTIPAVQGVRQPAAGLAWNAEANCLVMKVSVPRFHTPCFCSGGENWNLRPIPAPPEFTNPWEASWFILSNGWTVCHPFHGEIVWVSRLVGKDWVAHPLPTELTIWDASIGDNDTIYFAGQARDCEGRSGGHSGVIAVLGQEGVELLRPRFGAGDMRRLRRRGGDQSFDRIDASSHPIVVTSDCFTVLDSLVLSDLASDCFVITEAEPNWSVLRLNTHKFYIVREPRGIVAIFTCDGRRFVKSQTSATWQEHQIELSADAWPESDRKSKPVLGAVLVQEDALIAGVSLYPRDNTDGPALGTGILVSNDECKSFRLLMAMTGDVEVCGFLSCS